MRALRGFSLVEVLSVVIILVVVMGSLFKTFSGARRGVNEAMENQIVNDDLQRLVDRLTEEVREANYIIDDNLPKVKPGEEDSINIPPDDDYLLFSKVTYDFKKDPKTLTADQVNYTSKQIKYYLVKEDPDQATGPYILFRSMLPFDDLRKAVESEKTIFPVMNDIDQLLFYRLEEPDARRSGNLYMKVVLSRQDKPGDSASKYTSSITMNVKERGAEPQ